MTTIIIDNFQSNEGLWVPQFQQNCVQYRTKSGAAWHDMRQRCKIGGATQNRQSRYIGCTISENFTNFQFFAEWHIKQVGFGFEGYQLDKDLLISGNKEYHEDKCVLIPRALNMFLISEKIQDGFCCPGIYYDKRRDKFVARISITGKMKFLGQFENELDAFHAYKDAKEKEARCWAKRCKENEFVVDERVIDRLESWKLVIK